MTRIDEPPVPGVPVELVEPPAPPSARGPHPPRWLWLLAGIAVVPILVPLGFLFARVIGATDAAWSVVASSRTWWLLVRTTVFTAAVTATSAVVGVAAAWATVKTDLRWKRLWSVLVTLPLVVPSYVIALSLLSAFGPRGIVADLTGIALPDAAGAAGAWAALVFSTYPYVYLVTAASLRRLDPAQEEAARGLGASPWRTFRTVTLPQLRPSIAAGSLLVALYTLSDFGAVSLMRFDVFTRVIYAQYQGRIDRTPAAVLAAVLILVALGILWMERRTRGRATYYTRRPTRPPSATRLTPRGLAVTVGLLAVLVAAALGLPMFVLFVWLIRSAGTGELVDWGAVIGSVVGSSLAALAAMLMAVPVATLAVRWPSRLGDWIERVVYVIFAVPHITTALAVVFFAANYLGSLYQSLTLLVLVYAVLFLAQASGSARATLLQVNPHLEEASRGLGTGPLRTLQRITVPLMWRGLAAGGALVFLTTMKELPATLLLRPTGFDTLAVDIWSAAGDLLYARAAAPSLLLVAVSAVPMYLLATRNQEVAA